MIPQIIFQTYKTHEIPKHWKSSPQSIQKFMPTWKYVFMDDAQNIAFVKEHFHNLLHWFLGLKYPIQRADVIRYMFLYVHGGLYLDMDIELVASLEPLLESGDTFLVKAPRNWFGHYTNFLMASKPKNKFFLAVIDECLKPLKKWNVLPHHIISNQTGIGALNRAIKHYSITTLPYNQLVPCDYCNESSCDKPFYYTKFLKGQSWNNLDTYALNFLSCHYDLIIIIFLVLVLWKKIK